MRRFVIILSESPAAKIVNVGQLVISKLNEKPSLLLLLNHKPTIHCQQFVCKATATENDLCKVGRIEANHDGDMEKPLN